MSQFGIFLEVGVRHILNLQALDHLLFLLVLVAPYRLRDWRRLVAVASAFTLGHSLTLALVVTGTLAVPMPRGQRKEVTGTPTQLLWATATVPAALKAALDQARRWGVLAGIRTTLAVLALWLRYGCGLI